VSRTEPQIRSAYTDETLANSLRGGIDPEGRELLPIMPRYHLEDRDMRMLTSYLRMLSAEHSPGVTDTTLHLATIITEDVSAADRAAMMGILDTLVKINRQTVEQRKHPQFSRMFRMLDNAYFRFISIEMWELKGGPETWRSQLEQYYRDKPVFAILGGISGKSWQPIHDFCESNRIPCLFPITDLPVVSADSWYTLYASKGYYQEGEAAARFLAGQEHASPGRNVVQVVSATPAGEALASGFDAAWGETGAGRVTTVTLSPQDPLGVAQLQALLQQHRPDALVLWGGAEVLPVLTELARQGRLPDLFLSSRYLGNSLETIPQGLRDRVYLTYPYRLPEDEKRYAGYGGLLHLDKQLKDERRIASRTFSMVHLFLAGLKELRLDFYRDTLLDLIGMLPDQYLPDFERYSFGPGQRYASKGCYIVQLGPGTPVQFIKKSDWVIY
jgi:ABC-type branched-subunit amino acid transport system substrate-binding protein